jgi:protein-L-isoaspartate(D-aspartate) O-methyltransferase
MDDASMTQDFAAKRQQMIDSLRASHIHDERVLAALGSIPREVFVEQPQHAQAYEDRALPIYMGQTISQPLMVAIMTQALRLQGQERVLEIGTGSGYQAAILSRLAAWVYSVERIQQLAAMAAKRLSKLGMLNVSIYVGDGSLGWPGEAPYDRIIVTAAAPDIPQRLYEQLVMWGLMVIPVGGPDRQDLLLVRRASWGQETYSLGGCLFVPLVGEEGWHTQ